MQNFHPRKTTAALGLVLVTMAPPIFAANAKHGSSPTTAQLPPYQVKVYLVAVGDRGKMGKQIGCGDSLVPVLRTPTSPGTPLKSALEFLLSAAPRDTAHSKLENFWKGRNLQLKSVKISRGVATIVIDGDVFVAGVCDLPRITEQIEATARQFPSVKKVQVFMGRRSLAEAIE